MCCWATAAAAVGDPHSLLDKSVTLPTFQPPMGWLKASAFLNAAWGSDVIRTRAGTPHKKEGKKKGKYGEKRMKKKKNRRRKKERRRERERGVSLSVEERRKKKEENVLLLLLLLLCAVKVWEAR